MLVTLALLGLLVAGLTQGTRFGLSAFGQQARLMERGADLDAVYRTLRHLIEHARPGSESEPLVFIGTARSAAFTSVLPLPTDGFRARRADVVLSVDAAHRLVLAWTPHLHAIRIRPPPPAALIPVLPRVERLDLTYASTRQNGGWTSVWHDPMPPRLVRLRIVFADASHPGWPDLIVAPRLDPP